MSECVCGHMDDEHEDGFISACTIPDDATIDGTCPCIMFEEVNDG